MATADGSWLSYAPIAGLVTARCIGVFTLAPPLGLRLVPPAVRIGAACSFALCLTPVIVAKQVHPGDAPYLAQACGELATGAVIGFIAAAVVWVAMLAGQAIDVSLGASGGEEASHPFETLYGFSATVAFMVCGGPWWVIRTLLASFRALPPGHGLSLGVTRLATSALPTGALDAVLFIAAPVLVAIVCADLVVAVAARCAPPLAGVGLAASARWIAATLTAAITLPFLSGAVLRLVDAATGALTSFGVPSG